MAKITVTHFAANATHLFVIDNEGFIWSNDITTKSWQRLRELPEASPVSMNRDLSETGGVTPMQPGN